jgi:hypothetical protein
LDGLITHEPADNIARERHAVRCRHTVQRRHDFALVIQCRRAVEELVVQLGVDDDNRQQVGREGQRVDAHAEHVRADAAAVQAMLHARGERPGVVVDRSALSAIVLGFAEEFLAGKHALDRWLSWARRCRIPAFVHLARRITAVRDKIHAALEHGLSNALIESVNTKIRLLTRIAFGFRSAPALIALAMLSLGGHRPDLPGRPNPRISQ